MFGENLTTEGLLENSVNIGDRIRVGSAVFEISEPRMPCFKLGIRFENTDIIEQFLQSRRSGFYLRVKEEGDVGAGDEVDHGALPMVSMRRSTWASLWLAVTVARRRAVSGGTAGGRIAGTRMPCRSNLSMCCIATSG